jgi:hypothetical protein
MTHVTGEEGRHILHDDDPGPKGSGDPYDHLHQQVALIATASLGVVP